MSLSTICLRFVSDGKTRRDLQNVSQSLPTREMMKEQSHISAYWAHQVIPSWRDDVMLSSKVTQIAASPCWQWWNKGCTLQKSTEDTVKPHPLETTSPTRLNSNFTKFSYPQRNVMFWTHKWQRWASSTPSVSCVDFWNSPWHLAVFPMTMAQRIDIWELSQMPSHTLNNIGDVLQPYAIDSLRSDYKLVPKSPRLVGPFPSKSTGCSYCIVTVNLRIQPKHQWHHSECAILRTHSCTNSVHIY